MVKLSYSTMPNVASLIKVTLKKCQFECRVYKVKVHSCGSNDSNISRNVKKVYIDSMQGPFKKRYYNPSSFAHAVYRLRTSLSKYVSEIKNLGTDPILEWEIVKKKKKKKKKKKNSVNKKQGINTAIYVWRRNWL